MDPFTYRIEKIRLARDPRKAEVRDFLESVGLSFDPAIDLYYAVYKGKELVGGAGYDKNVIKGAAVKPEYRSEGILNAVLSRLRTDLSAKAFDNVFVFTKPENRGVFQDLGFVPVEQTRDVLLMESDSRAFPHYLANIARQRRDGVAGAVVMNCNPFTKGHLYLVEQAAAQCDNLILFVVEEDLSVFPFPVRLRLVQEGTTHIPNVAVVPGGPYIISSATFPTYFLKDKSAFADAHAELDVTIFGRHIAPAGGISKRFAGEEPFSPVTALYNAAMTRLLPAMGVEVTITPRCTVANRCISATTVRDLIAAGGVASTRPYVPDSTYNFLLSPEAQLILQRIQS